MSDVMRGHFDFMTGETGERRLRRAIQELVNDMHDECVALQPLVRAGDVRATVRQRALEELSVKMEALLGLAPWDDMGDKGCPL